MPRPDPGLAATPTAVRAQPPLRALARFAIIVVVLYAGAMLAYRPVGPWPGAGRFHAHCLAALAQAAYGGANGDRSVTFSVISPPPSDGNDIQMTVGRKWQATTSSLLAGYGPAAMVVALIVATPIRWRRRLIALATGLILMHGLIILRMGAHLWFALNGPDAPAGQSSPSTNDSLTQHLGVAMYGPSIAYATAVLIWLVVAVRTRDLARFGAGAE